MLKINLICFIGVFFLCYSCDNSKTKTPKNDYKLFNLSQSGWKSKSIIHQVGDLEYKATEVPLQYYILKNSGLEDPKKVDSIYQLNASERIIEMEFTQEQEKDLLLSEFTKKSYEESVKYMAFGITNDFQVVTRLGDTIACSGVTFERNFKLAPFKRLLLHFGNIPPTETIQLVYRDELFGNGLLKFNFEETPIKL